MKYQGGKHRQAGIIASAINYAAGQLESKDGLVVIQPFCGALSVEVEILKNRSKKYKNLVDCNLLSSDLSKPIVQMWQYFLSLTSDQLMKEIPKSWTKNEHDLTRSRLKLDSTSIAPVETWLMHACSFGGGWCNSFGDNGSSRKPVIEEQTRSLIKKHGVLKPAFDDGCLSLASLNYNDAVDEKQILKHQASSVVYCDPPYKTIRPTKEAHQVDASQFKHEEFWSKIRLASQSNRSLILSTEYTAPADFVSIYQWTSSGSTLSNKRDNVLTNTNENLYVHTSKSHLFNNWKTQQ